MKTFDLINGDLAFADGDFVMAEGSEEFAQCLEIMLSTYLDEWFLNRDFGVNYHLLLEKPDDEEIAAEIARVLGQEERVNEILSIRIVRDKKKRSLSVHYEVTMMGEKIAKEVNIHGTD